MAYDSPDIKLGQDADEALRAVVKIANLLKTTFARLDDPTKVTSFSILKWRLFSRRTVWDRKKPHELRVTLSLNISDEQLKELLRETNLKGVIGGSESS